MKVEHIVEILDRTPLNSLSAEQLQIVETHIQICTTCDRAYQAARVSRLVIKERAEATVEPSPFFQTKVMAAWRERQAAENIPVLSRLWKSAGGLVSSMAMTTAALAALSFFIAAPVTPASDETAAAYSAESVLLGQAADDQMSYDQVLSTIYIDGDEGK
jgi:hypothetical protein